MNKITITLTKDQAQTIVIALSDHFYKPSEINGDNELGHNAFVQRIIEKIRKAYL